MLTPEIKLSLQDSPDEVDPELQRKYQGIIGSLPVMYLYQWTRPDLGFAVTFLSRYLHKPGVAHMNAAKRVLIYLQGTAELILRYIRESDTLDIMDIHGHFWICMDMDMVDIQMDIHFGYVWMWIWCISKRISKIHVHVGYPRLLWISNMDTMSGYP